MQWEQNLACNLYLDEAHLDVVAENFWSKNRQKAFFDVKVFNPLSRSYVNTPLAQCSRCLLRAGQAKVIRTQRPRS